MKLSIIIVSWNTVDLLRACLFSVKTALLAEKLETCETIVVDNASADGSAEMVAREFPFITLIASAKNLGFGGGNNLGYSRCHGDFVLLLNPDTELRPGTLTATLEFLEKNASAGAVGVRQVETTGNLQESCGRFPSLRTMAIQNLLGIAAKCRWENSVRAVASFLNFPLMPVKNLKPLFDFGVVHEVDWIMGAFMLLRRKASEQVTSSDSLLFDPRFVMFGEEIDLCRRITTTDWKIFYVPDGEILHHGGASTAKISERAETMRQVGMIRYYEKHHGPIDAFIYRLIIGLTNLFLWLRAAPGTEARKRASGRIKAACFASYEELPG